jgi:hypothetical protein
MTKMHLIRIRKPVEPHLQYGLTDGQFSLLLVLQKGFIRPYVVGTCHDAILMLDLKQGLQYSTSWTLVDPRVVPKVVP